MMEKTAIIVGASGLIGTSLLEQLLADQKYKEVLVIVRKKLDSQHPKLRQLIVDFDQLDQHQDEIRADVVFCCLGTTKNKTPDLVQYKKIDYQYPLDIARIAYDNGASQYHFISSIGADASSGIFYTRTKGEAERDLQKIPFESIHIYQPSLLVGKRKEPRTAEGFMIGLMNILNPLLIGGLKKYRSIKVSNIAKAMIAISKKSIKGIFIYPSDKIEEISSTG